MARFIHGAAHPWRQYYYYGRSHTRVTSFERVVNSKIIGSKQVDAAARQLGLGAPGYDIVAEHNNLALDTVAEAP
jgi:hypothetical protein